MLQPPLAHPLPRPWAPFDCPCNTCSNHYTTAPTSHIADNRSPTKGSASAPTRQSERTQVAWQVSSRSTTKSHPLIAFAQGCSFHTCSTAFHFFPLLLVNKTCSIYVIWNKTNCNRLKPGKREKKKKIRVICGLRGFQPQRRVATGWKPRRRLWLVGNRSSGCEGLYDISEDVTVVKGL